MTYTLPIGHGRCMVPVRRFTRNTCIHFWHLFVIRPITYWSSYHLGMASSGLAVTFRRRIYVCMSVRWCSAFVTCLRYAANAAAVLEGCGQRIRLDRVYLLRSGNFAFLRRRGGRGCMPRR